MENIKKNKILLLVLITCIGILGIFSIYAQKDFLNRKPTKDYYGGWVVEKYHTPDGMVGAEKSFLTKEEINNYLDTKINFDEGLAKVFDNNCTDLIYKESKENTSSYLSDYKILRDPNNENSSSTRSLQSSELGIESESINLVEIKCNDIYYNLLVLSPEKSILVYKDTFFFLKKNSQQYENKNIPLVSTQNIRYLIIPILIAMIAIAVYVGKKVFRFLGSFGSK